MDLPDVNIFIYALRDEVDDHDQYRAWLHQLINGPSRFAYADTILASVVRVATLPVWRPPSPIATVLDFCTIIRSQPNAVRIEPGQRTWDVFADLCRDVPATGNLAADAFLAALAIEHGCTIVTCDADFARFPGLRWRHPLQAQAPKPLGKKSIRRN